MATGPVGGPITEEQYAALLTERDALARRCAAAEQRVGTLEDELATVRGRLSAVESAAAEPAPQPASLSLFEGADDGVTHRSGDGTDPRVVSVVFAATAIVAGMVALLALINGTLFSWFGLAMIALTVVLGYLAARTRVVPASVQVTRGVVYAERGGTSYRFDLRADATRVEQRGRVGDSDWQVRFLRRNMDPFVVDESMVDPQSFVDQLREYRPAL